MLKQRAHTDQISGEDRFIQRQRVVASRRKANVRRPRSRSVRDGKRVRVRAASTAKECGERDHDCETHRKVRHQIDRKYSFVQPMGLKKSYLASPLGGRATRDAARWSVPIRIRESVSRLREPSQVEPRSNYLVVARTTGGRGATARRGDP